MAYYIHYLIYLLLVDDWYLPVLTSATDLTQTKLVDCSSPTIIIIAQTHRYPQSTLIPLYL